MAEPTYRTKADTVFFSILLWLTAAAAAWLYLHPGAWTGRTLMRRLERENLVLQREQILNDQYRLWRNALGKDTSMLELLARNLGYGRPGEDAYQLSSADLKSARAQLAITPEEELFPWTSALRQSLLPALLLLIISALAVMFFTDLKVEDTDGSDQRSAGSTGH